MSTRAKKKRRLTYLALGLALLAALAAGGYVVRSKQVNARLAQGRQEGAAALAARNYEVALHRIGKYLQRNANDVDALYDYALAREHVPMADNKHIGQAITQYRRVLVLRPLHADARRRLLNLYANYGFTEEAIELADKVGKDDPDALRAKATAYARLRKYTDAFDAAEDYNEKVPADLGMQRLTFDIMLAQRRPADEVVARARQLEEGNPGKGRFHLLTGIALRMAGDRDEARESVRKAAADNSDNDPVFVQMLVEQLEALELFEDSVRVLDRAAGQGGALNRRLYVGRLFRAERYEDVLNRLGDVRPDDPAADPELLALRAAALSKLGRADESAATAAALRRRFDAGAEAWAPALEVLFGAKPAPPKDVIRVCTESLRRTPDSPYFHFYLAEAYAAVGEQEHALEHWAQATRLAPAWVAPRARLATAFAAAGRTPEALDLARGARNRGANDPSAHKALAEALAATLLARRTSPADPSLVAELRSTADKLDALKPDNDSAAVMRVLAAAAEHKTGDAVAAARAALESPKAYSESAYLGIAAVSKAYGLGLEDQCLARCEQALGRVTPALATHRARTLLEAGNAAEGRRVLEAARDSTQGPAEVKAWRTAWAGYLDATSDPAAAGAWKDLVNDFPDDAAVQALALRAASLRNDRATLDRTIDRLRDATGPEAVAWRLARARWIAAGATGPDKAAQLAKAASQLGDLCRDMPDLPEPRILLARCLQELGNPREAIAQLNRVVSSAPQLYSARLELAGLLQAQGALGDAKTHLDAVADDPSAPAQDRAAAATLLVRGGDADKALRVLEQLYAGPAPATAPSTAPAAVPGTVPGGSADNGVNPRVLLADLYRRRGDVTRAKAVLREVLQNSLDANAVALLAELLASEGATKEAEQELKRLDRSPAPAPQNELIRAQYFAARGDRVKALEQYTAATVAAPSSTAAWRGLARFHLSGGDVAKALAATEAAAKASATDEGLRSLQRLAVTVPSGDEARPLLPLIAGVLDAPADEPAVAELLKAVAEARANPAAGAGVVLTRVREIARRYPRALVAQNVAARTSVSAGGPAGAADALTIANQAMQNFPNAPEPAEAATAALVALDRWDEAAVMARQWKRLAPDAPGADIVIATFHLRRGQPAEAIAVLERLVPKQDTGAASAGAADAPHVAQATVLYCQALAQTNRTGDAEELLSGRLAMSPQYRGAWLEIAARYVDKADASRWLDTAAKVIPADNFGEQAALVQAWVTLADRSGVAAHQVNADAAVRALGQRTIESKDATAAELLILGILAESARARDLAETAYDRAIKKNPAEPVALNNLAMILAERGDRRTAEEYAKRAVKVEHPRRASFYDTLATVHERAQQWLQALESMDQALKLEPDNARFKIHKAEILLASGDPARRKDAREAVDDIRPGTSGLNKTDEERLRLVRERSASLQ